MWCPGVSSCLADSQVRWSELLRGQVHSAVALLWCHRAPDAGTTDQELLRTFIFLIIIWSFCCLFHVLLLFVILWLFTITETHIMTTWLVCLCVYCLWIVVFSLAGYRLRRGRLSTCLWLGRWRRLRVRWPNSVSLTLFFSRVTDVSISMFAIFLLYCIKGELVILLPVNLCRRTLDISFIVLLVNALILVTF